jgi:hypothetical protein
MDSLAPSVSLVVETGGTIASRAPGNQASIAEDKVHLSTRAEGGALFDSDIVKRLNIRCYL